MGPLDRLRLLIATGFGLGRAPVAPGTLGSAAALPLVAALHHFGGATAVGAGIVVVTLLGLASAGAAETRFGRRDPGPVVIDEIAGQMLSLLFLPVSVGTLVVGFLLFRLFDIWKPFPVRQAERLPGASGIMTDDLVAGIYANLIQQLLLWSLVGLR